MNEGQIQLGTPENDEPTAEELAAVPQMSRAEMTNVMKDEMYKTSAKARALVAASIAKGFSDQPTAPAAEPVQTGDEVEAKAATMRNLFRDPRYRYDAAYRAEVKAKIAEMTKDDNVNVLTGKPLGDPGDNNAGGVTRITVSSSPFHGAEFRQTTFRRVSVGSSLAVGKK